MPLAEMVEYFRVDEAEGDVGNKGGTCFRMVWVIDEAMQMFGAHSQRPWLREAAHLAQGSGDVILDFLNDSRVELGGLWVGRVVCGVGIELLDRPGDMQVHSDWWR